MAGAKTAFLTQNHPAETAISRVRSTFSRRFVGQWEINQWAKTFE